MFSFEVYFRNPYVGQYALKKAETLDGIERYDLCDGGRVSIIRSSVGWCVDDDRKSLLYHGHFRKMKIFKRYGNALSYVETLNAKVIEKILASA